MPKRQKDFLEEIIDESTAAEDPQFREKVQAALDSRRLLRELARQREALGLTQRDVANLMGTSQPAVARMEAGEIDAKLSTIDRYAAALGSRLSWNIEARKSDSPQGKIPA